MGAKIVGSWSVRGEIVEGLIRSALKVGLNYLFSSCIPFYLVFLEFV